MRAPQDGQLHLGAQDRQPGPAGQRDFVPRAAVAGAAAGSVPSRAAPPAREARLPRVRRRRGRRRRRRRRAHRRRAPAALERRQPAVRRRRLQPPPPQGAPVECALAG